VEQTVERRKLLLVLLLFLVSEDILCIRLTESYYYLPCILQKGSCIRVTNFGSTIIEGDVGLETDFPSYCSLPLHLPLLETEKGAYRWTHTNIYHIPTQYTHCFYVNSFHMKLLTLLLYQYRDKLSIGITLLNTWIPNIYIRLEFVEERSVFFKGPTVSSTTAHSPFSFCT
jgi:hypothetical protein